MAQNHPNKGTEITESENLDTEQESEGDFRRPHPLEKGCSMLGLGFTD